MFKKKYLDPDKWKDVKKTMNIYHYLQNIAKVVLRKMYNLKCLY